MKRVNGEWKFDAREKRILVRAANILREIDRLTVLDIRAMETAAYLAKLAGAESREETNGK